MDIEELKERQVELQRMKHNTRYLQQELTQKDQALKQLEAIQH